MTRQVFKPKTDLKKMKKTYKNHNIKVAVDECETKNADFDVDGEPVKKFSSGAKSSGALPRYDLIPRNFLDALAARFGEGAERYGEFNYRKGFGDPEFIKDRINHIINHLNAYMRPSNYIEAFDDNLAAVAWGVAFLIDCECDKAGHKILTELREEYAGDKSIFIISETASKDTKSKSPLD